MSYCDFCAEAKKSELNCGTNRDMTSWMVKMNIRIIKSSEVERNFKKYY